MLGPQTQDGLVELDNTYMQAILRIGMSAILEPRLMLRSLIKKTGKIANEKSHAAYRADMTYVKEMITSMLTHFPVAPMARVQKYFIG